MYHKSLFFLLFIKKLKKKAIKYSLHNNKNLYEITFQKHHRNNIRLLIGT